MDRASDSSSRKPRPAGFGEAPQAVLSDGPDRPEGERVRVTLETARSAGMLEEKTARISGRVSPALIEQAKRRTGIASDSKLVEFALASVALDDDFSAVLRRLRGTVDPDLPLGY